MPCFVCENCECIENTALSSYWATNARDMWLVEFSGKILCSECAPPTYKDGSPSGLGEWHGRFPKEHWSVHYSEKPKGLF